MPDIRLERGDDGWITAECPALSGCISQGRTEEEALRNLREGDCRLDVGRSAARGMSRR